MRKELEIWKLITKLRRNENLLENFVQGTILLLMIVWQFSPSMSIKRKTTTAMIEEDTTYAPEKSTLVLNSEEMLIFNLLISLVAFSNGNVMYVKARKTFLRFKGHVIYLLFYAFCCLSRLFGILMFFTPNLGLFQVLRHLDYGKIPWPSS